MPNHRATEKWRLQGYKLVESYSLDYLNDDHTESWMEDRRAWVSAEREADTEFIYRALTRRQRKVAQLLVQGYTHQEIGTKLGCSKQNIDQMVPVMKRRLRERGFAPPR